MTRKVSSREFWRCVPEPKIEYPVIVDEKGLAGCVPVTIYGLVDPAEPGRIRYVGQTRDPKSRYTSHRNGQRSSVKLRAWTEMLRWERRALQMVELEYLGEGVPKAELLAYTRERAWILALREIGQADLNDQLPVDWDQRLGMAG